MILKNFLKPLIFTTTLFISTASMAQTITGTVKDGDGKNLSKATVILKKSKDSTIQRTTVSEANGQYEFTKLPHGAYFVNITAIGHEETQSSIVDLNTDAAIIPTITLNTKTKALEGVVVTAKRPLIEVKAGKMIVNVDAAPSNTGLNALELLEKSPGVTVDNDGNISLKGKQGVMIMLDGKPTYMSGTQLAELLKSMPSNGLDQIEIMTNPPAKYDAAGNSGIINIKTKKGVIKGMNGTANLGYVQGVHARYNGAVNINYRNNKLNLFGGFNAGKWDGYRTLDLNRKNFNEDNTTIRNSISQATGQRNKGYYQNAKAGFDYNLSKKDVIGVVINGNFGNGDERPMTNSNVYDAAGTLDSKIRSWSHSKRKNFNIYGNVNYKHTFDSTGREITVDYDNAYYKSTRLDNLTTRSLTAGDIQKGLDVLLNGNIPSIIKINTVKVDYLHPFTKTTKLEAGVKSSFVNTDNRVHYDRSEDAGATWFNDNNRTNNFLYKENINAVYGILSTSIKKWEFSAGLRLENTNAKGQEMQKDSAFTKTYTNLFPNGGISYNASDKHQWNFSYSRRISRPDYDDLNPFVYFLDSLTYNQGNPYLQPQFTNNYELSHTYNRFLTTTLNYSQTNDIITEMIKAIPGSNANYQTRENFGSMKQIGLSVNANVPVTKWWTTNFNTFVYNQKYEGIFNNGKTNEPIEQQMTTFTGNMTNTFTFAKTWNAELSGWYRSKGAEGLMIINDMYVVSAGISKQLLKKKATLKLGVRDIFKTQNFSGYAKYSNVDINLYGTRDSRQFNLSFTYKFGKTNIAPERRRRSASSDEQNRVNSGGGN